MVTALPDLSYDELRKVARACAWVVVAAQTPQYFQPFLVRRLESTAPDLARRVAAYEPGQMEDLCEWLRDRQQLLCRV
jgi:hypothetical protein